MKKFYESIFILDKNANEELIKEQILNHFNNNNVKELEYWGVKKLAYPVQKNNEGYYVRFIFTATDKEIDELHKLFSNKSGVLKYIFIAVDTSDTNYYEGRLEFEDSLEEILDIYTENTWRDDPLTNKEIEALVKHLENRLKFMCGTITEYEYRKLEG